MTSNQHKSPRAGNQGGTHQQHVEAGRQSHKNDASRQSDSLSNQQSGNQSIGSQQSGAAGVGSRSDSSQQSGRQSNQSQQSGSRSGAGVQGGTPEQHAAAGRQSHKNDKNR